MKRSAYSVGLLVLTALALGLGFLFFLTADAFRSRGGEMYETYFRESVQGLDVGSTVRFRGVQVGRVTQIGLVAATYRSAERQNEGAAFRLVLVRFSLNRDQLGAELSIERSIANGLRARLSSQGITGVSYIELDFVDTQRYPIRAIPWEADYPVIPSMPSTTAQVQSAAEALMSRLEQIDLNGMLTNLSGLVTDLRTQLAPTGTGGQVLTELAVLARSLRQSAEAADLPALATELRNTVAAAHAVIDSPELRQALREGSAAMTALRQASQRLPNTVGQLESALRGARGATLDTQAELVPLLRDLRAVTGNLRDVTEMLRRSPSQTLLGAPPPAGGVR
jgi:ABC-type transporter Mla subunit MlaD